MEKGEHLKEALRTSLDRIRANTALTDHMEQLKQKRQSVELAAREASEKMKQHYRNVTSKLSEVLHKQYNVIDDLKRKQMREIDGEERRMNGTIQLMEGRKAEIYNMMHQPVSPSFIQVCKENLAWAASYQGKWKGPVTTWKQTVFIPPEAPSTHNNEYLDHCERFILGHFVNEDMEERRKRESIERRNAEETRRYYSSPFSGIPYSQNNYHRSDSVSVGSTLRYNDPDEYATQYTASNRVGSVTSQAELYSNTYEDDSTIVPNETDAIYEEVTPHANLSFPPNVIYERPAPSSPGYVRPRNPVTQLPPASTENSSPRRKPPKLYKDLISYTDRKSFRLKVISDVVIKEFSIWLCGWSRNVVGNNDTVLLNIDAESSKVLFKTKRTNSSADLPTILVPYKEDLLLTMKGGHKVYCFSEKTHCITKVYDDNSLRIKAMCCNDEFVYFLDTKSNPCVRRLSSDFDRSDFCSVVGEDTRNYDMDMCTLGDTIFISTAKPMASVKALRQNQVTWQVNNYTNPLLTPHFDPCSVAASVTGDIFVADRGTNKVRALCSII